MPGAKAGRARRNATTIEIAGRPVLSELDIAATAGGLGKAVDLVCNDIRPKHGVIAIHLHGNAGTVAMIQAIEVGPGPGARGPKPVSFVYPPDRNLLGDPGFEDPVPGIYGGPAESRDGGGNMPWSLHFSGPGPSGHFGTKRPSAPTGLRSAQVPQRPERRRIHPWRTNAHTHIFQDVSVLPRTAYRALGLGAGGRSAWQGDSARTPATSAGLRVIEMDDAGKVLGRASDRRRDPCGRLQAVSQSFTTRADTPRCGSSSIRSSIAAGTRATSTYDDCALAREVK